MKRLLQWYGNLLKVAMTLLMAVMLVPVTLQIVSRYTGLIPRFVWTEEVARFCFVWIIMIGATIAVREGTHFKVELLPSAKSKREEVFSQLIVHAAMLLMAVVFSWYGWQFASSGAIQHSEMTGINMLSIYISFPAAGLSWIVFLVERMADDWRTLASAEAEPHT